jgi:hypothetical protein
MYTDIVYKSIKNRWIHFLLLCVKLSDRFSVLRTLSKQWFFNLEMTKC